ncbi:MAG: toll/interleukin-1 receptor domain-containing protein [Bacteroidetes bacterium]|nr:toll/interleukin-1 receptor domain-containing protein [Bacteroidota bacterium]
MKNIFISYSHADREVVEKFKRHISTFSNDFIFWDDSKIVAGQIWRDEIESALNNADIGLLFISADFFNSDFIQKNELPPLLSMAKFKGLVIISIIVKPCLFSEYPDINCYQAINNPEQTIVEMSEAEQEKIWVNLMKTIKLV